MKLDGNNVGARVTVTTNESTQMQEIRAGSNFVSQNPLELH
ncbi:MAG: ASPIC/UnbV domain-containing protein, partial [Pseudomonadota bacterium]